MLFSGEMVVQSDSRQLECRDYLKWVGADCELGGCYFLYRRASPQS